MSFTTIIEQVSKDLIYSFNERNFDKLLTFLATNFVIESENIQKVDPTNTENIIRGNENSIAYWKELVKLFPAFKFDPTEHTISKEGKNIVYTGHLVNGKPYSAKFTMNEYAKFECLKLEYPESI